ncbi:hypothetical protein LP419_24100 [Massilia sp. H-1]|nr:hypothetical protein LP419_24100 [Massilia sp. H-1]
MGAQTYVTTLVGLLAALAPPIRKRQRWPSAPRPRPKLGAASSTSETITQVAIGVAAMQPGNAAVAQPAVYGPIAVKAQTTAQAAGAAAGATAGAAMPRRLCGRARTGTGASHGRG